MIEQEILRQQIKLTEQELMLRDTQIEVNDVFERELEEIRRQIAEMEKSDDSGN